MLLYDFEWWNLCANAAPSIGRNEQHIPHEISDSFPFYSLFGCWECVGNLRKPWSWFSFLFYLFFLYKLLIGLFVVYVYLFIGGFRSEDGFFHLMETWEESFLRNKRLASSKIINGCNLEIQNQTFLLILRLGKSVGRLICSYNRVFSTSKRAWIQNNFQQSIFKLWNKQSIRICFRFVLQRPSSIIRSSALGHLQLLPTTQPRFSSIDCLLSF